jgi:ParB/RepB/Spo0J family partition protein
MKVIPLSSVFIPDNRQRREFNPEQINDLSTSIRLHGLFHPIVCAPEGSRYRLVAGERRFRAISSLAELGIPFTCGAEQIPAASIPITLLSELDTLTLREIELEENTIRVDLNWQDRVRAISDLDALRKEQNASHTTADTAREIFGYSGSASEKVREASLLTEHLSDPDVQKAKSHSEAVKVVKKKLEAAHRAKLAAEVDASQTPHTFLEGDSLSLLDTLQPGFSCIITDPPYGINADAFGDQASTTHYYEDTLDYAIECYTTLAEKAYSLSAEKAHLYAFCSIEHFHTLSVEIARYGWSVWPRPLIWSKGPSAGMLPRPEHGPRYTYECIIFASKGDKPTQCVKPDVISLPPVADKVHAAEKPIDLYLDLLSRSCLPGDRILDPFCGSGVVFSAANQAKLTATGIELDPRHSPSCLLRMKG